MISTPEFVSVVAIGSIIVGIAVHRAAYYYLSHTTTEEAQDKPMTYAEAMASMGPPTKRKRKKKRKPELVTLSLLRYGEYSTDDSKLTIQAWRPDASHRLAGHIVVDIIPKPAETLAPTSVRRLAIDLETVEAARFVSLTDGDAVILAVSDYEVKGQGIIFRDLDYTPGVGIDDAILYILLVVRHTQAGAENNEFRRLAAGLQGDQLATVELDDDIATFFADTFRSII